MMKRVLNGPQGVQLFLPKKQQYSLRTLGVSQTFLSKLPLKAPEDFLPCHKGGQPARGDTGMAGGVA